ncbi:MAG: aspartate aminotransferase family protein [Roseibium sp.]|uniref:pyridoxal phosphate-dependent decarboxylase family protein n=1 Tax=Roseibium sp. TaxID=1936156 RepID=UPI003D9C1428
MRKSLSPGPHPATTWADAPDRYDVLQAAQVHASAYRRGLEEKPCTPKQSYREMLQVFSEPLPETGSDGSEVLNELVARGEQGLTPMTHPGFFGWVLGGSSPVGVAADWLASAWGQNAAFHTSSPTAAAVEKIAAGWLLDVLHLPEQAAVGFVTGATVGNFTALAAARGAVLRRAGWDADNDGLFGAPPITVYAGDDAHTSVFSALGYLGLGRNRVRRVRSDDQGRMMATDLARQMAELNGPSIVIAQAGQINTGAFDPFPDILEIAKSTNAWVHVDGAFGLWARAHPEYRFLTEGVEHADSWAVDGHKWLQTPFDSGYAIVRDRDSLQRAMSIDASYLPAVGEADRIPSFLVPELSRRARGLPTWAMLKSLGRQGVEDLVGRHCAIARKIAEHLGSTDGIRIVNDVVLNQVIISFGHPEQGAAQRKALTEAVIARLRDDGSIFVGGARWRDDWVMRISVICDATQPADAEPVADVILKAWAAVSGGTARAATPVAIRTPD